jgi:hypothetical protein
MEKFQLLPKEAEEKYHSKIKKLIVVCSHCGNAWGISLQNREMVLTSDDLTCGLCGNVDTVESRKIE